MADTLARTLGTRDLTLLVIGNVIGSGIFLAPSLVMAQSGWSVPLATAIWLIGGLLSLMGALSYAELGSMPETGSGGGLYAYIRDAFGPFLAFLYGWTLFFVIGAGTIAALCVAAANYMTQFMPMTAAQKSIVAVTLIVLMMVINVRGTRESATVQNLATGLKVVAIVAMSAILFALGEGPSMAGVQAHPSGVSAAIVGVLWAFEGWQYVTFVAAEAKDPQRSLPRAIVLGTVLLIALYVVANFAYVAALGPEAVGASERVAGDAMAKVLGPGAGGLTAAAIIVSMYSAAHATVITVPRVYYAMARDGVFFRRLAEIHPRYQTPAIAIITSCLWAIVLALSGSFEQLLTYVVSIGWIFYGLGAAAVIALRIKRPDAERAFKVPFYPLTPILFVLAAAVIIVNPIFSRPAEAAIGLSVVLAGAPAYIVWRRRLRAGAA